MSDLIQIEQLHPEKINVLQVFTPEGVDPILKAINDEVKKFTPDMTTKKGREEIASMAYKVAKSKTYLDDLGKKLVAEWKEKSKIVDESRKKIRDTLDSLKDEVRKPLTEWEDREAARIKKYSDAILALKNAPDLVFITSDQIREKLADIEITQVDESWGEFEAIGKEAKEKALVGLKDRLTVFTLREAEQAELKKLREEAAERERADREKKIAEDAATKARLEAEQKAKAEADRIEREKQEAILSQKAAEERVRFLEREKIEAERKAVEEERIRVEQIKQKEIEAQKLRDADVEHRRSINKAAVEALAKEAGVTEDQAKLIVILIAQGKVPSVSIRY